MNHFLHFKKYTIFGVFLLTFIHLNAQCDSLFSYYQWKCAPSENINIKPVILGPHGGTFSCSSTNIVFSNNTTGEIALSPAVPKGIYSIDYSVNSCSYTEQIFISGPGGSLVQNCGDTLQLTTGSLSCSVQANYNFDDLLNCGFDINLVAGQAPGSIYGPGLDSSLHEVIKPAREQLIAKHYWSNSVLVDGLNHKGEEAFIQTPVGPPSYAIPEGIEAGNSNADGLRMELPMYKRDFDGINVSFNCSWNTADPQTVFFLGNDTLTTLEIGFIPGQGLSYLVEYLLPNGSVQTHTEFGIFMPAAASMHSYRFIHNPSNGNSRIYVDGSSIHNKSNPSETILHYVNGDAKIGQGGSFIDAPIIGYGFGSNVPVFGQLELTELTKEETRYCKKYIRVSDQFNPTVSCPNDTTLYIPANSCSTIYHYDIAATDNCGSVTFGTGSSPNDQVLSEGSYSYNVIIEDGNGNSVPCSWNVDVVQVYDPEVSCQANEYFIWSEDGMSVMPDLSYLASISEDGCGAMNMIQQPSPGALINDVDDTNVQFFAEYSGTKLDSCSFVLNWGHPGPIFISCPDDIIANAKANCGVVVDIDVPTNNYVEVLQLSNEGDGSIFFTDSIYDVEFQAAPINDTIFKFTWDNNTVPVTNADIGANGLSSLPGANYASDGAGGYFLQSLDSIKIELPMDFFHGLNGMEVGFDYSAVLSRDARVLQKDGDFTMDLDHNFYLRYKLEMPDLSIQAFDLPDLFNIPLDDEFHSYLFRYDDHTGVCQMFIDGIEVWQNPIVTPGAKLVFPNASNMHIADDVNLENPGGGIKMDNFFVNKYTTSPSCFMTVEVIDTIPPSIDCPLSQTIFIDSVECHAVFQHDLNIEELCSSYSISNGIQDVIQDTLEIGTHVYDFNVINDNGYQSNCTFEIEVEDNSRPTLICPSEIGVNTDENCEYQVIDILPHITYFDCSGIEDWTQSPVPGISISGPNGVTVHLIDSVGLTSTCFITLTPFDTIPPSANCPSDTTIFADPDQCGTEFTFLHNATDNCSSPQVYMNGLLMAGSNTTDFYNMGPHYMEVVSRDDFGIEDTCHFSIIVEDNLPPAFISCDTLFVVDTNNDCSEIVNYSYNATDNCTVANDIVYSHITGPFDGDLFPAGPTLVSYSAEDQYGNIDTCEFVVFVEAGFNWTLQCPSDQNISTDLTCSYIIPDYTVLASALDLCNNSLTYSQVPIAGTSSSGVTEISISAIDEFDVIQTCTFSVIPFDNEAPLISCPPSETIYVPEDACTIAHPYEYSVSDNCGIDNVVINGYSNSDPLPIGTHMIELIAFDGNMNSDSCSFEISVQDTFIPTLMCDPVLIIDADEDCQELANFTYTASDNCGTVLIDTISGPIPGDVLPVGDYTIVFAATDQFMNTDTCSFQLSVVSTTPWSIEDLENDTLASENNCSMPLPDYRDGLEIVQICANVEITQDPIPGTEVFSDTLVTVLVSDDLGNIDSTQFFVHVLDSIFPSIECPDNVSQYSPDLFCGAFINYDVSASDNCAISSFELTQGIGSGNEFPVGVTPVEFIATDNYGNLTTCNFTVEVLDTLPPVINCESYLEFCDTMISLFPPSIIENCGISNITNSFNGSGAVNGDFNIGTTFVNWIITDINGNEGSCIQEIFVHPEPVAPFAGLDQNLVFINRAAFNADELDNGIGTWSLINGSGNILDENDPGSWVEGLSLGINEFEWTVEYDICPTQSDTVILNVIDIRVPTGFSPDGDRKNDLFVIDGLEHFENNSLQILNRWGRTVYESSPYRNNWNATNFKNTTLPSDTYYYILKLNGLGKEYKGYVVIKR